MNVFKQIWILVLLFIFTIILGLSLNAMLFTQTGNVAVIPIYGDIGFASQSPLTQSADANAIISALESAKHDSTIKAILLDINSGGGTVVAAEQIGDELKTIGKPVVALIRETGASGAYWIASFANKIVASNNSIVGSIGVTASYLDFAGLLQNYNVTYVRLVSGENKDIGSPYRAITNDEYNALMKIVGEAQQEFLKTLAENRNMSIDYLNSTLGSGMIFSGADAKTLGLLDFLGGESVALNVTASLANLTEAIPVTYAQSSVLSSILSKFFSFNGLFLSLKIPNFVLK